jgi:hypothetical protein
MARAPKLRRLNRAMSAKRSPGAAAFVGRAERWQGVVRFGIGIARRAKANGNKVRRVPLN